MIESKTHGAVAIGVLSIVLAVAVPANAQGETDLWVLNESEQIFTIGTRSLAINGAISLAGFTYTGPTCMDFSTVEPRSVFVTQGSFVRVVDVATKTVRPVAIDVAALLGIPEIQLTACSAAIPRTFLTGLARTTASRLFVAGQTPAGDTRWVVLDQARAIAGSTNGVLVDSGRLSSSGRVLDVQALDDPQGDAYQRAWFTVSMLSGGNELLLNYPLSVPENTGDSIDLGRPETLTLPTVGLPLQGVGIGAAPAGKFAVRPGFTTGQLTNLDTGDTCVIPGSPTQLSIHGPAPNSYSVFALDPFAEDLIAIDPNDCSTIAYDVGGGPVALVPRREQFWDGMFVLNNSGDSISFLEPAGDLVSVGLPAGSGPLDGGIAQSLPCAVEDLRLDKNGDDIELSWNTVGCAVDAEFFPWCNCVDDDLDCPCACDCTDPAVDPDCACPFAQAAIGGQKGGIGDLLLDYNPGDQPSSNPWKKLESTFGPTYCHEGVVPGGSWFYLINQSDEPPTPSP